MIPPQLALFAAKHSKKLIYLAVIGVVCFTIWLAFNYHERVVGQNAELRGQLASTELAREVDGAKMNAQANAIEKWRVSQATLQAKLEEQSRVQEDARSEKRSLNETFREHDLSRLAAAKPGLVERLLNRGTARMQRLLVCASAGRKCDDDGHPDSAESAESSAALSPRAGAVRVEGAGSRLLPRPGRSVLLRCSTGLRGSGPQSCGNPPVHPRSAVATGLLPKGSV